MLKIIRSFMPGSSDPRNTFKNRHGVPTLPGGTGAAPDIIRSLPLDLYFDFMAVRLDGDKAAGKSIVLNWRFTDTKQDYVLNLENSALTCVPDSQADAADATLTLTRTTLDEISLQKTTFPAALQSGQIAVTGKDERFVELLDMLDMFPLRFPVVEPRQ